MEARGVLPACPRGAFAWHHGSDERPQVGAGGWPCCCRSGCAQLRCETSTRLHPCDVSPRAAGVTHPHVLLHTSQMTGRVRNTTHGEDRHSRCAQTWSLRPLRGHHAGWWDHWVPLGAPVPAQQQGMALTPSPLLPEGTNSAAALGVNTPDSTTLRPHRQTLLCPTHTRTSAPVETQRLPPAGHKPLQ